MMGALRTLHAWAGVGLAVLAVVFGLTGSLLVFEDDWIRATVPAARVEPDLDPARLGAALDRLEAAEPDLTSVVLAGGAVGVHRLYLPDEVFGYSDANGAVVERWRGAARAETLIFDLHHELLAGHTGKLVAGGAGLALVLLILTGLIVWLPAWRATGCRVWPDLRDSIGRFQPDRGGHRLSWHESDFVGRRAQAADARRGDRRRRLGPGSCGGAGPLPRCDPAHGHSTVGPGQAGHYPPEAARRVASKRPHHRDDRSGHQPGGRDLGRERTADGHSSLQCLLPPARQFGRRLAV
jgi:hypothetical protein